MPKTNACCIVHAEDENHFRVELLGIVRTSSCVVLIIQIDRKMAHGSMISVFFFNDTATTEIYTLSLHDALPILGLNLVFNLVDEHVCHNYSCNLNVEKVLVLVILLLRSKSSSNSSNSSSSSSSSSNSSSSRRIGRAHV